MIKAALHAQGRIPSPAVRLPLLASSPGATGAAVLLTAEAAVSAQPHDERVLASAEGIMDG